MKKSKVLRHYPKSEEDDIILGKSIPSNEEFELQIETSSDS